MNTNKQTSAPTTEQNQRIIAKYNSVLYVNLRDGERMEPAYLLVSDNKDEFAVDLTGNFVFNELEIVSELEVSAFESLTQLLLFLKKMGIEYDDFYDREGNFLLVGGSRDMAINEQLIGRWLVTDDADK